MASKKPKIPRNVLVVAFVALASGLGQDLITPVLPGFLTILGFSRAGIGLIDGLLQGATSVFRFISGILSDRFKNRKIFVFIGYALSSVTRPLLALTGSFVPIAILRLLDGVGKGTKDAPRDALVADSASSTTQGRAFGFHRLVDTAGSVIGPLIAGGLLIILLPSIHTYRTIFALATIPGAIALGLIFFGVREPKKIEQTKKAAPTPLSWRFWFFTIGMAVAMFTKINDSLFLVRAHDIGVPQTWIPLLFAGFTFLYAILSYPIGILSDRFGKLPFIATGWLVLSGVEFGFAHDPSLATTLILFAGYGLFFALTEGSARAFIADLVSPESRGSAYALFHTLVGLAIIGGGYYLGHLWDTTTPEFAFTLAGLGSLLGFFILTFTMMHGRPQRI